MIKSDNLPKLVSPWNALTISKLVDSAGRTRSSDIIFVDAPDTSTWLHRPAKSLTYFALSKDSQRFASQLTALGIKQGDAVMLMLPNAVEFPVACLGAMLAGMVPVPVSIGLSPEHLRIIAELSNAKAIITVSKLADIDLATIARSLAAQVFSIRAVASFGIDVPAGVVSLEGWDEADLALVNDASSLKSDNANLITVEFVGDTPRALVRTQSQLIAEAMALSSTSQVGSKSTVISTIIPGSAFSFISNVVLPILVRAQMNFHGVFSSQTLLQQIKASSHICLIAPLAAEEGIAELAQDIQKNIDTCILLRRLEKNITSSNTFLSKPIVDVTAIGDAAHICVPRKGKDVTNALPQNWRQPGMRIVEGDILLVKTRIDSENRVSLSGFGVASLNDAPLGSAIEGGLTTEFFAQISEVQTFIPFDALNNFIEPELGAKSAA